MTLNTIVYIIILLTIKNKRANFAKLLVINLDREQAWHLNWSQKNFSTSTVLTAWMINTTNLSWILHCINCIATTVIATCKGVVVEICGLNIVCLL